MIRLPGYLDNAGLLSIMYSAPRKRGRSGLVLEHGFSNPEGKRRRGGDDVKGSLGVRAFGVCSSFAGRTIGKAPASGGLLLALFLLSTPLVGSAQLSTETIDLHRGWNAVWLNVDPEPSALSTILAAQNPPLDYQTIWAFEPNGQAASTAPEGRWFFHARDVPAFVNTLGTLAGARGYFIRMNAPGTLVIPGRPLIRTRQFFSRTSNLGGALTHPKSGPPLSFEHYFSHPNARGKIRISGSPARPEIFKLVNDSLVRVPIANAIEANVAYWINVVQDFEYRGPIDVKTVVNGFNFGRSTSRQTIELEVPATESDRILTLRTMPCDPLSEGEPCVPPPGGADWLEFRDPNVKGKMAWQPLSKGTVLTVPEGQSTAQLDIRARRTTPTRAAIGGDASPQTLPAFLDIVDDRGGRSLLSASVEIQPVFGSWVGRATLTKVGTHPAVQDLPLEQAEAEPFRHDVDPRFASGFPAAWSGRPAIVGLD